MLAYGFLRIVPFADGALEAIGRARARRAICAPDSFRAELLSVAWQVVRAGRASVADARAALRSADAAVSHVESTFWLWNRALELAIDASHSPYDTLFVALAEYAGTKVVTYDGALLKKFPRLAIHTDDFLAAARRRA